MNKIVDYVSFRDASHGSIFIRTVVSTFYKQAGRKHATELSDQVYVVMIISLACYSLGSGCSIVNCPSRENDPGTVYNIVKCPGDSLQ